MKLYSCCQYTNPDDVEVGLPKRNIQVTVVDSWLPIQEMSPNTPTEIVTRSLASTEPRWATLISR